jgi:hypothetical protein
MIDEKIHTHVAQNFNGQICGFQNPPVRNYDLNEWMDSVTGEPGDLLSVERWEITARVTADMQDLRYINDRKGHGIKKAPSPTMKGNRFKRKDIQK